MGYNDFYELVEHICEKDKRYKADSYEFIMEAVRFSQVKFAKAGHVSGKELLEGVRDLAVKKFGPMTRSVFQHWGISTTEDFGNIVFNMIDNKLLQKTESDCLDDFKNVYSFDEAFKNVVPDITPTEEQQ